jgi:hypothetical protein
VLREQSHPKDPEAEPFTQMQKADQTEEDKKSGFNTTLFPGGPPVLSGLKPR